MGSDNLFFLNKLGFTASFWDDQIEIISFVPFLVKRELRFLLLEVVISWPKRTSICHFPFLAQFMEIWACIPLFFIGFIEHFSLQN